jgi:hypothetical protein
MKIEITEQLYSELIEYMGKKPYHEVAVLIAKLAQSRQRNIVAPATVEPVKE